MIGLVLTGVVAGVLLAGGIVLARKTWKDHDTMRRVEAWNATWTNPEAWRPLTSSTGSQTDAPRSPGVLDAEEPQQDGERS